MEIKILSHNEQPKLIAIEKESWDKQTRIYKRKVHLVNTDGNKVLTIEDKQLKTGDARLCLHGTETYVKCYEKYFMVERVSRTTTMSEQNSASSFIAYDYNGKMLGKSRNLMTDNELFELADKENY